VLAGLEVELGGDEVVVLRPVGEQRGELVGGDAVAAAGAVDLDGAPLYLPALADSFWAWRRGLGRA
jgi:hypothetical protein